VADGVIPWFGAQGFLHLPHNKSFEGCCLQSDGLLTERPSQASRPGEKQITSKDRHRISPHRLGRCYPAALNRIIHHIIVVQGGKVGKFGDLSGGEHAVVKARTPLSSQQSQQWANTLSPRIKKMAGDGVRDFV